MRLIVYGDFNCPYSALTSHRLDRLAAIGRAEIDFRAVEHDADVPEAGEPMTGEAGAKFHEEVDEVNGLVREDEDYTITVPKVRPNTSEAIAAYASREGSEADEFRQKAFAGVWQGDGVIADLGDPPAEARERARGWQEEWLAFDKRIVPMLVLPDGYVSRGLGALKRLSDLLDG